MATDCPEKVINPPCHLANQKAATLLLLLYYNLLFLFLQLKLEPELSHVKDFKSVTYALKSNSFHLFFPPYILIRFTRSIVE